MNKLAIGLSISSIFLVGAGCGDSDSWADESTMGTASFALQNGIYSLAGSISIFEDAAGTPGALVRTVGTLDSAEDLSVELTSGDYHAILDSWILTRIGDVVIGSDQDESLVTFGGITPTPFPITSNDSTLLTMTFQIGTAQTVTVP
jgi:hypothetical protein